MIVFTSPQFVNEIRLLKNGEINIKTGYKHTNIYIQADCIFISNELEDNNCIQWTNFLNYNLE